MNVIIKKSLIKKSFRWQIKSSNGEIICASSEFFKSRDSCLNNLMLTQEAISKAIEEKTIVDEEGF